MFNDSKYGIYTVNGNDHGGHGDSPSPQKPASTSSQGKPSKPESKGGKQAPGKK
jgi:hypothetical protein